MASNQTDRRDGVIASKAIKNPVKAASTANLAAISGLLVIDGYQTVAGDRILLKNQTTQTQNGIYNVAAGTWTRAKDCDGNLDLTQGTIVHVLNGTVSAGLFYELTTTGSIVIGTSNLTWAVVSPSSPITLPLSLAQGGTAATTAIGALANLGVIQVTGEGGAANAQTGTVDALVTAFRADQIFIHTPSVSNTGAMTITYTPSGGVALAAKNVFSGGAALVGGEFRISVPTLLHYDGVQLNILGHININGLTADATPDGANDFVETYDASAVGRKKVLLNNLPLGQVATQSQQESASSTTVAVTPGRQQFHPSAAKGWAQCTNAGSASSSYNVTSVTDSGVGAQTINWSTAFSSVNYCVVATACTAYAATAATSLYAFAEVPTAAAVAVNVVRPTDGSRQDPSGFTMVAAFGDQ